MLDVARQLSELLHCFNSRCLTCSTQSLASAPPSVFYVSLSNFLPLPFLPLLHSLLLERLLCFSDGQAVQH